MGVYIKELTYVKTNIWHCRDHYPTRRITGVLIMTSYPEKCIQTPTTTFNTLFPQLSTMLVVSNSKLERFFPKY